MSTTYVPLRYTGVEYDGVSLYAKCRKIDSDGPPSGKVMRFRVASNYNTNGEIQPSLVMETLRRVAMADLLCASLSRTLDTLNKIRKSFRTSDKKITVGDQEFLEEAAELVRQYRGVAHPSNSDTSLTESLVGSDINRVTVDTPEAARSIAAAMRSLLSYPSWPSNIRAYSTNDGPAEMMSIQTPTSELTEVAVPPDTHISPPLYSDSLEFRFPYRSSRREVREQPDLPETENTNPF